MNASQREPYDVFISYHWRTKEKAKLLHDKLAQLHNMKVWREDEAHLENATNLNKQLNYINRSKVVVCCMDQFYYKSKSCLLELNYADSINKRIIVLMIDDLRIDQMKRKTVANIINSVLKINSFDSSSIQTDWLQKVINLVHLNLKVILALKIALIKLSINKCFKDLNWKQYSCTDWINKANNLKESSNNFEDAVKCFNKALLLNQNQSHVWHSKGVCLNKLNKFEEAIKCFNKTLELNPNKAIAWYSKGCALHHLNKFEDAIKCYNRALGTFH